MTHHESDPDQHPLTSNIRGTVQALGVAQLVEKFTRGSSKTRDEVRVLATKIGKTINVADEPAETVSSEWPPHIRQIGSPKTAEAAAALPEPDDPLVYRGE